MARDDLFSTPVEIQPDARPLPAAGRFRSQPLAARMRPRNLDEYAGQSHMLAPGQLLRRAIEADRIQSLIFFGPPGTGKTSLAQIIARQTKSKFERLSGGGLTPPAPAPADPPPARPQPLPPPPKTDVGGAPGPEPDVRPLGRRAAPHRLRGGRGRRWIRR